MTTFATNPELERRLAELAARTRLAWSAYADALSGLAGREYETAEAKAWEQLQATLSTLDSARAALTGRRAAT